MPPRRSRNPDRDYEDPPVRYPLYNLGLLPDPPDNWLLWNEDKRAFCGSRRVSRAKAKELADFHFWGINPGIEGRDSTERLMVALRKLMYYQSAHHRPPEYSEFLNTQRDAGPRLLDPNLVPQPLPISRFFSLLPQDAHSGGLSQSDIARLTDRQRLYPSTRPGNTIALRNTRGLNIGSSNTGSVTRGGLNTTSFSPLDRYGPTGGLTDADIDLILRNATEALVTPAPTGDLSAISGHENSSMDLGLRSLGSNDFDSILGQMAQNTPSRAIIDSSRTGFQTGPATRGSELRRSPLGSPGITMVDADPISRRDPISGSLTSSQMNTQRPITRDSVGHGESSQRASNPLQSSSPYTIGQFHSSGMSNNTDIVTEDIQRTIMRITYRDLERHTSALPRGLHPQSIATSEEHLLQVQQRISPIAGAVRLSSIEGSSFRIDPNGINYAYRGRGPVWRNNSCAVDCVIVAGRLLDAGCTNKDRASPEWDSSLTVLERAYIQAININWDILSREQSMDTRDRFWEILAGNIPSMQVGIPSPPTSIWEESTKSFEQFKFSYTEEITYCSCRRMGNSRRTYTHRAVSPAFIPTDQNGVSMETLIQRSFRSHRGICRYCRKGIAIRSRTFHQLPLRMVVQLHKDARPRNHTANITIEYKDQDGQDQRATYRWLGGIYRTVSGRHINELGEEVDSYHFRVYWTDVERGEMDTHEIRMYDGMENLGLIAGNIAPSHRDERVPEKWWKDQSIPLLFYERVLNPESEVLSAAKDTIMNMIDVKENNGLIMQQLCQWRPSNMSANPIPPERTVFQPTDSQILSMPPRENVTMGASGARQILETYFDGNILNPSRNRPPSSFVPDFPSSRQTRPPVVLSSSAASRSSFSQPGSVGHAPKVTGHSVKQSESTFPTSSYVESARRHTPGIHSSELGGSFSHPATTEDDTMPDTEIQSQIREQTQHNMPSQCWLQESLPPHTQHQEHDIPAFPDLDPHFPEDQPQFPELPNLQEETQTQEQQEESTLIGNQTTTRQPNLVSADQLDRFARGLQQSYERLDAESRDHFDVFMMHDITPNPSRPGELKQEKEYPASIGELWDWIGMLQQFDLERMEEKWEYLDYVPEERALLKRTILSEAPDTVSKRQKVGYVDDDLTADDFPRKKSGLKTSSRVDMLPTMSKESEGNSNPIASEKGHITSPSHNTCLGKRKRDTLPSSPLATDMSCLEGHTSAAQNQTGRMAPPLPPQADHRETLLTAPAEVTCDDIMGEIEIEDLDRLFEDPEEFLGFQ
ncbi:hypothetical protein DTO271G3_7650 [Paecilomyces variotii]|nr:hypothetical protein DTO271G3_7650 [Paecilomyces variotii]